MPLSRIQTGLFSGDISDSVLRSLLAPPVPTSLSVTDGNAQATLAWAAPTVLTQTPITDYAVQYSSNSGSSWALFSKSASTATSVTVTGLNNGTAYTFRVAGINAIGTGNYSTQSAPVILGSDPFLSSVSLAINFEGSFSDQSANAYTVTANGGASISSSVFAVGARSALFVSSSSQYATVTGGIVDGLNPLIFGTSDFCLESWVYPTSYTRSSESVSDVNFDYFFISNSNGGLYITNSHNVRFGAAAFFNNQSTIVSVSGPNNSIPLNAWTHISYSRSGTTGRLFVNGVLASTTTDSTNYSSPYTLIGGRGFNVNNRYFNGYLDGVRITKGQARYTSNFTPTRTLPTF